MNYEKQYIALDRVRAKSSLAAFVKAAWPTIEPSQPYRHGWHIDAICEHLEAVTAGKITRLLINVPPGTMKSLLCGVFWPAWEWGPQNLPAMRHVAMAHGLELAVRDNIKARRLIESKWYQDRWPTPLTVDQNAKVKFENTATGFRQAAAAGSITGVRGDRIILDDPHSVDGANSDAERNSMVRWFREALPTRLNNPETSPIVVIMQRLHAYDISGVIIENDLGYEKLILPMEYEPERRCVTSIGFKDPRTEDGELLFPGRFPAGVIERDKKAMGSYAWAGQMQQRPTPRDGGMFKRDWFEIVDAVPKVAPGKPAPRSARAWDLAGTVKQQKGDPDYTVGCKQTRVENTYYVENIVRFRESWGVVETTIKNIAEGDGRSVPISVPQDPGQAGKSQAAIITQTLAGWIVTTERPTGSKEVRARAAAVQAEAGNIKLVRGPWNEAFLAELCDFPNGRHDDQVDAFADAFNTLTTPVPNQGFLDMMSRDLAAARGTADVEAQPAP